MSKLEAIAKVCLVWGVSEEHRLNAIQFIIQGVDCQKVVKAIEDVSVALKALEILRPERQTTT